MIKGKLLKSDKSSKSCTAENSADFFFKMSMINFAEFTIDAANRMNCLKVLSLWMIVCISLFIVPCLTYRVAREYYHSAAHCPPFTFQWVLTRLDSSQQIQWVSRDNIQRVCWMCGAVMGSSKSWRGTLTKKTWFWISKHGPDSCRSSRTVSVSLSFMSFKESMFHKCFLLSKQSFSITERCLLNPMLPSYL